MRFNRLLICRVKPLQHGLTSFRQLNRFLVFTHNPTHSTSHTSPLSLVCVNINIRINALLCWSDYGGRLFERAHTHIVLICGVRHGPNTKPEFGGDMERHEYLKTFFVQIHVISRDRSVHPETCVWQLIHATPIRVAFPNLIFVLPFSLAPTVSRSRSRSHTHEYTQTLTYIILIPRTRTYAFGALRFFCVGDCCRRAMCITLIAFNMLDMCKRWSQEEPGGARRKLCAGRETPLDRWREKWLAGWLSRCVHNLSIQSWVRWRAGGYGAFNMRASFAWYGNLRSADEVDAVQHGYGCFSDKGVKLGGIRIFCLRMWSWYRMDNALNLFGEMLFGESKRARYYSDKCLKNYIISWSYVE